MKIAELLIETYIEAMHVNSKNVRYLGYVFTVPSIEEMANNCVRNNKATTVTSGTGNIFTFEDKSILVIGFGGNSYKMASNIDEANKIASTIIYE